MGRGGKFVYFLIIVVIFMGYGETCRLGEDFKFINGGQATKGWEHFLLGELTPQDTK